MKISKENHKRTAVVVKKNRVGGVVYKVPGGSGIDLNEYLAKRSRDIKILYNIFNQIQAGTAPSEYEWKDYLSESENKRREAQKTIQKANYELRSACGDYAKKANSVIGKIIFSAKTKRILSDEQIISNMKAQRLYRFKGRLEDFVLLTLRKSLIVSNNNGEVFDSRNAVTVFLKNIGKENISEDDEREIKRLLALIRKDYNKWNPGGQSSHKMYSDKKASSGAMVIRSIEHQNMVVQPKEDRLRLSEISSVGKNTKTKQTEKAGLEAFLTEYAQIDANSRMEYLKKLRRLLDTYFAAPSSYIKGAEVSLPENINYSSELKVWERHEAAKKVNIYFVEIPEALLKAEQNNNKIDSVEKEHSLEQLRADIRRRNIACYHFTNALAADKRYPTLFFENMAMNQYWIHHMENAVERILKKCNVGTLFKLKIGYLSEKVWKDVLNLLSIKYIALGKAVYHFALDDIWNEASVKKLGKMNAHTLEGISSFDYEMVKAQEDLQREMAVGVAFSANNLARATCQMNNLADKESDFLLWDDNKVIAKHIKYTEKGKTLSAILQFFGGRSSWDTSLFENAYSDSNYELQFLNDLRRAIYAARNETFHFKTAAIDEGSWNTRLFGNMFEKEAEICLSVEKNKFYSNNLALFYTQKDLKVILDRLYGKEYSRAAQIPSYNTILSRKSFPDFLKQLLKLQGPVYDLAVRDQWYSACYYLFKEVYYNLFLQDVSAKELFEDAVKELEGADEKQKRAVENFKKRYREISISASLADICQSFMTEYSQQNNKDRKVRSANDGIFNEPIYQHYKMLLRESLKVAFASYIKNNKELEFVFNPTKKPFEVSQDRFLPDWSSEKYDTLISEVKNSPELQKWYIVGKFMNARMLNLTIGSMRSYLQYVNDIQKRAASLGERQLHLFVGNVEQVKKWIQVLECCLLLSVRISNEFKDYFINEDAYASYLKGYVDFEDSVMPSDYSALLAFSDEGKIDLYVDASNPKVNRNIIQAKLYAPDLVLKKVVKKISKDECKEFYEKKEQILQIKNKGDEVSWEEQQKILEYQKLKNRVELRNLAEYGELINELLGQLINWSYLRERDLLYFQLGFHYSCLMNESKKPDAYKTICIDDAVSIENAVLYQIIAMYINGFPVYVPKKGKLKAECKISGGGIKVPAFCRWASTIEEKKLELYCAGLELFEVVSEHGNVIDLRNKIDHFKYYQGNDSILSLYGEIFDRFFTYDMKYRKNVLNHLQNILLRHNVVIKPVIGKDIKKVGKEETKDRAAFLLEEVSSDRFTYKVKEGERKIDAKNRLYLETVRDILYFPNRAVNDKGEDVIICSQKAQDLDEEKTDRDKKHDKRKNGSWKKNGDNQGEKSKLEEAYSNRITWNPFAGTKLD
mgnify:CR=1 FL=1